MKQLSPAQIVLMKRAGEITKNALLYAETLVKPGVTTNSLDNLISEYIINHGGKPCFKGYNGFPKATCISVNEVVVHGIPSQRKLKEGDIVSIDVGVEYKGFHGDAARTFPVGKISEEKQKLIDVTKHSFFEGIKFLKAGEKLGKVSSAIQKYAIWARNELIDKVTLKAFEYGVSKDEIIDANADSVNGKILTSKEKTQRQELINKVTELGFDETIEEIAYTWFNRFIALRFMEVNNYLPTRIRVFTNENNEFKPEILNEAMNLELEGLDKKRIYMHFQANNTEELYKYILICQCNDLGRYLPGMFTKLSDYKVLI